MPFLTIPASSKPCIGRQGVRIGELEAIRRKYVNFLDFDFSQKILLYAKKNTEKYKKIFGRLFWTDVHNLLVLQSWYVFYFWYKFFQI